MTNLKALLDAHRIFIILGPYGSGKTEIAINLALLLSGMGRRTALADLDIVNPYFRSREKGDALEEAGVRLIAPARETWAADLPAVPPDLWTMIQDETLTGVMDIGGDKGAVVLAAFAQALGKHRPAVWYVVNQARLITQSPGEAAEQLRQIEARAKLSATGLVNNTHLLDETDAGLVLSGARFTQEIAALTGLPLICHGVKQSLAADPTLPKPILPLTLLMKRPWE